MRVWNIELTLVPSLQIRVRKYSAGKYSWHRFRKSERPLWDSKENDWLSRISRWRGSLKKVFWKSSKRKKKKENTGKRLCRSLLFDKVSLCRSATSFKSRFQHRQFVICKNTFFAKHHRTTALDYSSINSSEGVIDKTKL